MENAKSPKMKLRLGIGRASFYRWRQAFRDSGEDGLTNARSVPHNHPNKTPAEVVEKVIHWASSRSASIRRAIEPDRLAEALDHHYLMDDETEIGSCVRFD